LLSSGELDFNPSSAQDVSGPVPRHGYTGENFDGLVPGLGLQAFKGSLGIFAGVEGFWDAVLGIALFAGVLGLFFLQFGGIGEDNARQVGRGFRTVHRTIVSILDQFGKVTRVVQVGMG
jgi:hypothetical protein